MFNQDFFTLKRDISKSSKKLYFFEFHVVSYKTYVAYINPVKKQVEYSQKYSNTTSRHINYIAKQLGFDVVKVDSLPVLPADIKTALDQL